MATWHRSLDNEASGEGSCHHQPGTDVLLGTCTSALFSPVPLPLVLEPPGDIVLWQDVAPLEKAPSRSTISLLPGFLLRVADSRPLF